MRRVNQGETAATIRMRRVAPARNGGRGPAISCWRARTTPRKPGDGSRGTRASMQREAGRAIGSASSSTTAWPRPTSPCHTRSRRCPLAARSWWRTTRGSTRGRWVRYARTGRIGGRSDDRRVVREVPALIEAVPREPHGGHSEERRDTWTWPGCFAAGVRSGPLVSLRATSSCRTHAAARTWKLLPHHAPIARRVTSTQSGRSSAARQRWTVRPSRIHSRRVGTGCFVPPDRASRHAFQIGPFAACSSWHSASTANRGLDVPAHVHVPVPDADDLHHVRAHPIVARQSG